jgi:ribosome assembly protein 1
MSEQVEREKLERYRKTLLGYLQRIWALGPSHVGPNFLLLFDFESKCGVTARPNGKGRYSCEW